MHDWINLVLFSTADAMSVAMIMLPGLLPESSVASTGGGKGRKRSMWKPSVAESMSFFVDVQKVWIVYFYALGAGKWRALKHGTKQLIVFFSPSGHLEVKVKRSYDLIVDVEMHHSCKFDIDRSMRLTAVLMLNLGWFFFGASLRVRHLTGWGVGDSANRQNVVSYMLSLDMDHILSFIYQQLA